MKIFVLASLAESLLNFRGHLLSAYINEGHQVFTCAPKAPQFVTEELKERGISFYEIDMHRTGMNPINDFKTFYQILGLLQNIQPDIMLSYTIKPVIYGSLAARFSNVPYSYSIITGLGYIFGNQSYQQNVINSLLRPIYRIALSKNHKIFFQNPDDQNDFVKRAFVREKSQTVLLNGSGVDLDFYNCRPLNLFRPIFLLIARLLKDKGIKEYVAAAKIIRNKYPQALFRLLGPFDSNPNNITKTQIEEWNSSGIIEYLGETKDVRESIESANVYVLPSYREGTPRTVLEAMAMGRPIITTDVPGCRETVIDGINGFLVCVKNPESLANAMEKFILEPNLIVKMGENSRKMAEEKYNVHAVNEIILNAMGLNKSSAQGEYETSL